MSTSDATASSREQTEIKNTDAVLSSTRFQGYHSNKEYIPFFNNMNNLFCKKI
jgi:hypothetical protein